MGKHTDLFRQRRKASESLDKLFKSSEHCLVIHYSCESFYDRADGRTARITSIAVRQLESGQTRSFSIHKIAELQKVDLVDIASHYDRLELEMLDEFFSFVRSNQHCNWLHWNMRDINYGFQAIEHRHRVLGGNPHEVKDEKKIDLSRLLISIYGVRYAGHPRLESIMQTNRITHRDFLVGRDEAAAWNNREFVKLHQSTLRKVDVIANVAGRAHNRTMVTQAPWQDRLHFHPAVVVEVVKEHWFFSFLGIVSLTAALAKLVNSV
ncbi:hypothetical protein ABFU65_20120 [Xanthomonas campestris pv. raphani]|uniref:hypothetical protein n=1 Tax=Xanthomonas campestris TaxID=339 RepID=UPI002B22536E|nr:hypothetical protein [Xanthomonas campestris]MEA9653318.1 hypothetical protein [Xanthomonas campestris pv. raphani]MEB2109942.1 hypothetical protein [Xanthomonas campestris pv. campestris]